ncbi:hypothetical protein [Ralstonia syzygii]|uniref:hypothetical protein n=1 Tax=Ralstonia syzygii TaxID=28097 RepID=UPI001E4050A2|nr:hypothetical protein [Ralstonia syzygii]
MFVEAKNAEGAVAGGKSRPGLSQSLARPARRICAHCLKLAICAAMPVAFAQMPSASGPSGAPGPDLRNGIGSGWCGASNARQRRCSHTAQIVRRAGKQQVPFRQPHRHHTLPEAVKHAATRVSPELLNAQQLIVFMDIYCL